MNLIIMNSSKIHNTTHSFDEINNHSFDEINNHSHDYHILNEIIQNILDELKTKYVVWFQSRLKTKESLYEKKYIRKKHQINDIIGFRIIYPWAVGLYEIASILEKQESLHIYSKKITENQKIIYLYGKTSIDTTYEIQLWPTILYTCFEYEHDKIYKPMNSITQKQQINANNVRIKEHELQDIIDATVLVPYDI